MLNRLTRLAITGAILTTAPVILSVSAQAPALDYELTANVRQAAELAQVAIQQSNFPAASSYLNQAALLAQTDGDRYVLTSLQLDIANRTFNVAGQMTAINALLASPLVGTVQSSELYYHRARISYNAQNVDAARADLQTAIDRGTSNSRVYVSLASLMDERGDHTTALTLTEQAFAIHRTAGMTIPVDWYRRAIHFAQELDDTARIVILGQSLVAEHPNQRNWRDVLILHRTAFAADPEAALDLWRLQDAVGALTGEIDYRDYAQVAHGRALPAEIERVVQTGRASSMLDGENSEISTLDRGTTSAAQSLRTALPERAQSAASEASGANALSVADGYMSLGDYAAAVPLYRLAIEKGSVDTELATLRLGIALVQSGDIAGARISLDQVIGPRASIGRLWRVFADLPRAAPAPALPTVTQAE